MEESVSEVVDVDMIPLDLRSRSVGRRGRRTIHHHTLTPPSSPPKSITPRRRPTPKTVVVMPSKEEGGGGGGGGGLDAKTLVMLLVAVVVIFFVLLSLFGPSRTVVVPNEGGPVIDVTRAELLVMLEKHQKELETFLRESEKKLLGRADAVKQEIPPIVAQRVDDAVTTIREDLKAQSEKDVQNLVQKQHALLAQLKEQLSKDISPLVTAELALVERRIRETVELQIKTIEQRIVSSIPASSSSASDLLKKDYALEILAEHTSATFRDYSTVAKAAIKIAGVGVAKMPIGPEVVTQQFEDNKCWAFAGATGSIGIQLRQPVKVASVGMQMTRDQLSFFSLNAPKEFEIYGVDAKTSKQTLLGKAAYQIGSTERQLFPVKSLSESSAIVIKFLSNHGAKDFTCVQKITVHE